MSKLGDTLRERRIALGLSVEQVEQATRIRGKLLEALEEGHYDRLPNPGYVRGYISSYGRFLELDTVPLLNMYKAETGAVRRADLNLPQVGEAVKPTGQQHAIPWRAAIAVAAVVAVLSFGIWMVVKLTSKPETPTPVPTSAAENTPANTQETTQSAPAGSKAETDSASSAGDNKPVEATAQPFTVKVTVDADGASWLTVKVDGKNAYAGTLAGGQSKQWEVTKKVSMEIGRPESVKVTRDGKAVKITDTGNVGIVKLNATSAE
ncbi:MAG TPA: RodZ domain-containing protein [Coriobacteriia bacterium]|nr:RodZ domain-containing protein [Coriobacteriia bacterium]